ncbi:MAG: biotin--[acetyl-CoA-carboxylase] ligase [Rhodocyclaceae bacterium]|nr:biotin--[acetyl-CoA-carboxylase] ligase [Rhodocyclaceae bacterium]
MLDLSAISQALGGYACRFDVDLLPACDSTNARLLARAEAGSPSGTVVVAEAQTTGRGRRGRAWFSAPGDSLTFSLLWRFAPGTAPAGLSLAAGLAVVQALEKLGAGRTALKWPNDILLGAKKLAGILIELQPGAPHVAVIGIGLNLRLPAAMPDELKCQSAALDGDVDPNRLLAALLVELLAVLETFAAGSFAALREHWTTRHAFENAPVQLLSDFAPPRVGICRGVDVDGALLLEADGRIERILSGEVSLRPA